MMVGELDVGKFSVIFSRCRKRNIQISQFKIKEKKKAIKQTKKNKQDWLGGRKGEGNENGREIANLYNSNLYNPSA